MEKLDRQLRDGIIPRELNYSIENACIDWDKLQYNSRYYTFEHHAKRLPLQWSSDELFIPVIEHLAEQAKLNNITPLNELEKINNISNINIDNNVVSDPSK